MLNDVERCWKRFLIGRQGKENFMEFMNDFLEAEAVPMRRFLEEISGPASRDLSYAKFDDYIDVCKNLSILYTLLSESLTKVVFLFLFFFLGGVFIFAWNPIKPVITKLN